MEKEEPALVFATILALGIGALFITDWWIKRPCKNEEGDLRCVRFVHTVPALEGLIFSVPNVHATLGQVTVFIDGIERPCGDGFREASRSLLGTSQIELKKPKPRTEGGVLVSDILYDKKSFKHLLLQKGCEKKLKTN